MARAGIIMKCEACKMENYITKVNKKTMVEKLEMKKFCPKCNIQTKHKEKK
ncbi:50S ribosomal protein L33 [Candidatus Mycoplasma mahonii]|uniref:50S ribosomal protein L33 n=1 Tax=Candidatus Mycoplasma mahonii TaxID=3004105 RepID=UPI0026EC3BE7|nr:50S ribosomal protein L33 [Candidatus Mycoplasma mahonii]WKX02214.1 50S ribosomal protein L33 [Candidatus Mycoplasma mahonii]